MNSAPPGQKRLSEHFNLRGVIRPFFYGKSIVSIETLSSYSKENTAKPLPEILQIIILYRQNPLLYLLQYFREELREKKYLWE